jgi:hypothetical protein
MENEGKIESLIGLRYIGERLQKAYRNIQDPLLLTDKQYVQVGDEGFFKIITT